MAKITLYVEANTKKAEEALANLRNKYDALSQKPVTIKVKAEGIDAISKEAMKAVNAAARLQSANAKINAQNLALAKSNNAVTAAAINSEKTHQQELEKTKRKSLDLQIQQKKTAAAQADLAGKTKTSSDELKNQSAVMEKLAAAGKRFADHFVSTLGTRLSQAIISSAVNATKEALNTMKAVDTELTNIRKVSDLTTEEVKAIGDAAYSTASKYGVAADEYLSAVYTYQKAGLGDNAAKLAELSTKTMLVGDTTADVASKFIIATNAAWGLQGSYEALNEVVDKADWINNRYATDLAKLSAGMPIVASTAANMNMTIDETLAVLGTITSLTQETGTKAATAWRALSMNIAGEIGTITDETGEEIEVTEEGIKSISDALKKYGNDAVKHAKATGEVIKPIEAVVSLAEAYRDGLLTDIELTNILMKVGGKLRTNQLTALVKDIAKGEGGSTYLKMLSDLGAAAGTADKEIELMMDSWERKTQVLKNTWTEFISNLVDTDLIKKGIEALTTMVEGLDTKVGRITTTIGGVTVAIGALFALFNVNPFVAAGAAIVAIVAGIAGAVARANQEYKESTEALRKLQGVIKDTNKEYNNTVRATEATGAVAQMYIDKLKDLESAMKEQRQRGLDVTEAQEEYHDTLVRLTNVVPELSGLIDLETDTIDGGTAALEKNTAAWIENAKAQAYRRIVAEQTEALVNAHIEKETNELKLHNDQGTGYQDFIDNYDAVFEEQRRALEEAERKALAEHRGNVIAEDFEDYQAYLDRGDWLIENENAYDNAKSQAAQVLRAIAEYEDTIKDAEEQLKLTQVAIKNLQNETGIQRGDSGGAESGTSKRDLVEKFREMQRQAQEAATETAGVYQQIGEDVGSGLAEGISASTGEVTAAAADIGKASEEALRDQLDTHSPSKVTEKIGEDTGAGLARGLKKSKGEVQAAAATMTRAIGTGIISQSGYIQEQISRIVRMAKEFVAGLMANDAMSYHWGNGSWVDRNGNLHTAATGTLSSPGGKTLVNELGPELISENGRAYIAGGGKPTVVNLSPGAIVIPADQTREALKGGMPKYARAQALNLNGGAGISISGSDARLAERFDPVKNRGSIVAPKYVVSGRGGGGKTTTATSSAPAKVEISFEDLEKELSDTLDKLEQQIRLAENEGDYPRVVSLYEQAREAVKGLVDQYRKAGYGDDSIEILTLLNKNYDYANKQLDVYRSKWDDLIAALEADTDATKALKDLEDKRAALEEAQAALANAQKQRTVRMYNAATGQWEWVADDKNIQNAQKALDSAQESYAEEVKSQAVKELEKMRDTVSDLSDVVLGPALSAVVTMAQSSDEFQNFARALNAVYGVGSFLQSTEGSTKAISTVDSHDTNYSFGGVNLTEEQAASMTLKDLAQMLQVLKIT